MSPVAEHDQQAASRTGTGILFIGHFPPPRHGHSLANERLLGEFRRRGYEVRVVDKGLQRGRLQIVTWFRVAIAVLYFSRRYKYPVYLTLGSSRSGLIRDGLILLLTPRRRLAAVHVHGGYLDELLPTFGKASRAFVGYAFKRVDIGVSLCGALEPQLHSLSPTARTAVVPNGIDAALLSQTRSSNDSRIDTLRVLFLANSLRSKGLGVLIDAMTSLCLEHPNWHLSVYGLWMSEGDESAQDIEGSMRSKAATLGSMVTFGHAASESEVVALLASSDVLVLPTSYPNEGQPLAIIEALVAGLHVVATDHRCIGSMFVDGVDGVLLPMPPTPNHVAAALVAVAGMAPMTELRRLEHQRLWSLELMADRILDLLELHPGISC